MPPSLGNSCPLTPTAPRQPESTPVCHSCKSPAFFSTDSAYVRCCHQKKLRRRRQIQCVRPPRHCCLSFDSPPARVLGCRHRLSKPAQRTFGMQVQSSDPAELPWPAATYPTAGARSCLLVSCSRGLVGDEGCAGGGPTCAEIAHGRRCAPLRKPRAYIYLLPPTPWPHLRIVVGAQSSAACPRGGHLCSPDVQRHAVWPAQAAAPCEGCRQPHGIDGGGLRGGGAGSGRVTALRMFGLSAGGSCSSKRKPRSRRGRPLGRNACASTPSWPSFLSFAGERCI